MTVSLTKNILMTKPVTNILPREEPVKAEKLLSKFQVSIEEVVNFGTHLLNWDIERTNGGDENLPIAMIFRHIVELTDSISILVGKSAIDASKPLLRSALESYLNLKYMLAEDSKSRALAFLVCNYHKELKFLEKLDPNNKADYGQLQTKIKNEQTLQFEFELPHISGSVNRIAQLEKLLSLPIYQDAENEYQRLRSQMKNPEWYRFWNGPARIEALADSVGHSMLYELLYRNWSGAIHGTDVIAGKLMGNPNGNVEIV